MRKGRFLGVLKGMDGELRKVLNSRLRGSGDVGTEEGVLTVTWSV